MALQPPQSPQTPKTPKASHAPKMPKDAKTPKAFRSFQPPQAPPPSVAVDFLASAGSDEYVMTLGLASPFDPANYPGCEFTVAVTGGGTDLLATYPIDTTTVPFNNTPAGQPFTITVKVAGTGLVDSSSRTYPPQFSPLSLSPALWLKASSLTLADDDPVATWPDLSGNGNDATQASSGARPMFKAGILNGKGVVRFDGVDDYLQTSDLSISQPDTIIIVAKVTIGTFNGRLVDSPSPQRQLVDIYAPVGFTQIYAGSSIVQGSYPPDLRDAYHILSIVFDGTATRVYVDGAEDAAGNAGGNGLGIVYLGSDGSSFLLGEIAEIIIYPTGLSDPNRGAVEAYLADEYAL